MELRHIRYFLEVADTLNFSRAAERLRVAQPALSKQIRALEQELGGLLFHRTTTKVTLTEMGHYFRQQTSRILMQCDIAVTGAQQLAKGASGTLKVGCDWRLVGLPIGAATRALTKLNPRLSVEFVERSIAEQISAVRDRQVDLGFAASIFLGAADDLELRRICNVSMKVLLSEHHRLASRSKIALKELKNERWLTLTPQSMPGSRVLMAQILQYTPKYGMATDSMPGLIAHVVAGHGVGLIPDWGSSAVEPGTVLVETDYMPLEFFAVYLKDSPSPLIPAYLDALESVMATRKPRARAS
jgi:DNA-binding transcriptional LysR family regulator